MQLTKSQSTAAVDPSPKKVIIAGPGSGKTHTTIRAIELDIATAKQKGDPNPESRIIAITFTVRAAQQLREKLNEKGIFPFHVGTLHSFILRVMSSTAGRITLLDERSAEDAISGIIKSLRLSVTAAQVRAVLGLTKKTAPMIETVIKAYRKMLRQANAADYDTLLLDGVDAVRNFKIPGGWFLYVDEFQDSSPVDVAIYNGLECARMWVVGDPDQSIYGWRGARMENLIEIAQRPDFVVHYLPDNFRSTPDVVDACQKLIRQNTKRLNYTPNVVRIDRGRVYSAAYATAEDEVAGIRAAVKDTGLPGSWGILTRYNRDREEIEQALRSAGVDVGDPPPPLPPDYRLGMAWLAMIANPSSRIAHESLLRAQYPAPVAQKRIEMGDAIVKTWPDAFETWNDLATVLHQKGVGRGFLKLLFDAFEATGSLDPGQLALAMIPEQGGRAGRVRVMTMHGAKGLEFDNVWIAATDLARVPTEIEAERRLFYVAMTRAKNHLWVSCSRVRVNFYTNRVEDRIVSPFSPPIDL